MGHFGLIWRTIRHLTVRQLFYQLVNRLRKPATLRLPKSDLPTHFLTVPAAAKPVSYCTNGFTFLNHPVSFQKIDWNYAGAGKLWTYNLNYFDFLNQPGLSAEEGLRLMVDFISHTADLRDGLESYPTSLRSINWVQFLSRNHIRNDLIDRHLLAQVALLNRRLEYHLAGNHLLENGFALLTGALYFQNRQWFRRAEKLVRTELSRQILADGGHDERSPMYHQLLLDRLLDVVLALHGSKWPNRLVFVRFLVEKASLMLGWLNVVSFRNGDVPMVNDSACGMAPTTEQLRAKAQQLGLTSMQPTLGESGYRLFRRARFELFADVAPVSVDHQPGHAHADTFSFVLYVDNQPVIVDAGTSTYQTGPRRQWERSTAAHNTVELQGQNSSEVWAGFRVGRRARVTCLHDSPTRLVARHDGYRKAGVTHERKWQIGQSDIRITDRLIPGQVTGTARFYFHPDTLVINTLDNVLAGPIQLRFMSDTSPIIRLTTYEMASGFNRLLPGRCLEISFVHRLETLITFAHEDSLPDFLF